jgi:hypothetical protein
VDPVIAVGGAHDIIPFIDAGAFDFINPLNFLALAVFTAAFVPPSVRDTIAATARGVVAATYRAMILIDAALIPAIASLLYEEDGVQRG